MRSLVTFGGVLVLALFASPRAEAAGLLQLGEPVLQASHQAPHLSSPPVRLSNDWCLLSVQNCTHRLAADSGITPLGDRAILPFSAGAPNDIIGGAGTSAHPMY